MKFQIDQQTNIVNFQRSLRIVAEAMLEGLLMKSDQTRMEKFLRLRLIEEDRSSFEKGLIIPFLPNNFNGRNENNA